MSRLSKDKRRMLRGLPPRRSKLHWRCPICNSDKNRSRHHIEPQRLRQNHARSNIDLICRPCHDLVEKAYDEFIKNTFPILWQTCRDAHMQERNYAYLHYECIAGRETVTPRRWESTGIHPEAPIEEIIFAHYLARESSLMSNRILYEACLALDWQTIYASVKSTLVTIVPQCIPDTHTTSKEEPYAESIQEQGHPVSAGCNEYCTSTDSKHWPEDSNRHKQGRRTKPVVSGTTQRVQRRNASAEQVQSQCQERTRGSACTYFHPTGCSDRFHTAAQRYYAGRARSSSTGTHQGCSES